MEKLQPIKKLLILGGLGVFALPGCGGPDTSPPVDASQVGPRGALKSQAMQDQMAKGNPNGSPPAPGSRGK